MNKAELLNQLQEENKGWEALLAQIGEARMDQPGVTELWSVKDVVAHLTGWRRRTVARLQAARRGEPEPAMAWPAQLQSDDEINAWLYEASRARPVRDVLSDARAVFQQLAAALDTFSDEELADTRRFPWMEGKALSAAAFFAHYHEEHEADLRAWLARQSDPPPP
jgi:hypothetical protein